MHFIWSHGGCRCEDCVSRMVGFAKLKEGEGKMIGRFHEMGRGGAAGVKIDGENFVLYTPVT